MADPTMFRVVCFFEGFGQAWTETYFSMTGQTHTDTHLAAETLLKTRTDLLAVGYSMPWVRTSDDLVVGDSEPWIPYPAPEHVLSSTGVGGGGTDFGTAPSLEDTYNPALLKYMAAPPNVGLKLWTDHSFIQRKTRTIAGVPLEVTRSPYNPMFPNCVDFAAPWQRFKDELRSDKWGLKVLQRNPPTLPATDIARISSDVAGKITVTLVAAPPANPATKVILTRPKCKPGSVYLNGVHPVTWVTGSNSFTLNDLTGDVDYVSGGQARAYTPILVAIEHVADRGVGTRKRGVRGYSPPAGRSRKRPTTVR